MESPGFLALHDNHLATARPLGSVVRMLGGRALPDHFDFRVLVVAALVSSINGDSGALSARMRREAAESWRRRVAGTALARCRRHGSSFSRAHRANRAVE